MIVGLTLILAIQLLGEVLARVTGIPVPGPVIGMGLLLVFLAVRDRFAQGAARILPRPLVDGQLEGTGRGLLANLSLMFVPAGAGIVGRLDVLAANGTALAVIVVVSTLTTLAATAFTFVWVARRLRPGEGA
ncbi:Holin-like protein CidA [Methylobacterium adhaesivum]|uniref:CidA/LrgA family protein n=1 Tax=Methylobacterium adhaesivum TaxID=333297 RepID=A0ABT8BKP3_9HYPH|nr:CidA/LrgA family protein [Methylobacterium adhaesivum]MDN3591758.1 CidA/LrgA family protein [Methylobacterium adhaesivum]GJD32096.1 Holin-like protein CidA [Methylobacterium adhaesivum]